MPQGIQTQGCVKCGGTMWRTVDVDENGDPTGEPPQFVCDNPDCGNVQ
ncbi:hypothetical protein [Streptomyces sp. NPDC047071]